MNMNELNEKVIEWATERNLHTADPNKQMLKLFEEVGEISSGMAKGRTDEIYDGIGDVKVVLNILKEQLKSENNRGADLEDAILFCLMYDIGLLAREVLFSKDKEKVFDRISQVEKGLDAISDAFGTTLEHCTQLAYNEIKDRKGKMIDGVFVKQEDLKGQ